MNSWRAGFGGWCAWACAAVAALFLSGCASTPQASPERDAEAKQFTAHPNAATIYVYRPGFSLDEEDSVLYVDNRLIGATVSGTYFRIDVTPRPHLLHGIGRDQGTLQLGARSGELYFVSLKVENGNSRFELIHPDTAKPEILRCCALLEKWAPGQRPLLR